MFKSKKKKNTENLIKESLLEELNELKTKVIKLQDEKISLLEQMKKLKQKNKNLLIEKEQTKHGRKTNQRKDKARD